MWLVLDAGKKIEKISEALMQLREIDSKDSKLKSKNDQGRLANIKKDLETFVINTIDWESSLQLQKHY